MNRKKKITILILALLTGVLATVAVLVSLNLREISNPAPDVPVSSCIPADLSVKKGFNEACEPTCGGLACDGDGPLSCLKCSCEGKPDTNRCLGSAADCTDICQNDIPPGEGNSTGGTNLPQFTCTSNKLCTLTSGTVNSVNCNNQSGYVFYCPNGFDASGRCLLNEQGIGNFQGGQTVDVNQYLNRGCGAYQVDFQPPGYPSHSGACGAVKYILSGSNCTSGGTNNGGGETTSPGTNSLSIKGRVVCADPGQAVIPMKGVRIRAEFTRNGETSTFTTNTNANGIYTLPASLGQFEQGRFNIYVLNVPAAGKLPNGKLYTELTGARAANCNSSVLKCRNSNNANGTYCNVTNPTDSDRYTSCQLSASPSNPSYGNFKFTYTNCGIDTAPRCGDAVCDTGEICETTTEGGEEDDEGDVFYEYKSCSTNQVINKTCRGIEDEDEPACTFCGDGIVQSPIEECDPNAPGQTAATCNTQCRRVTTAPRCGDAICQTGEFCESTVANGSTFRTCGTPSVSTLTCRGLGGNTQTPACTFCGDGVVQSGAGEQCDPNATGAAGQNCSPTCQTITASCVSLTRTAGPSPLRNGVGNTQEYTAVYRNSSTTNPFPNIRLRVNNATTPLGRDFNSKQNVLVSPISSTFDVTQSTWTYRFVWEAATVATSANVPTPPSTYPVRILPNGTTEETVAACTANVELSDTAAQEPVFSIIKEATSICLADKSYDIAYRIRVQNIGPVSGVIDYVEDTLDPRLVTANVLPNGINPNYGIYSAGKIRWEGTQVQRTYASGETKEFSFTVRIPSSQINSFNGTNVQNDVLAIYDTQTQQNNTISFTLRTAVMCSTIITPVTGLFDSGSPYILLAFLFILAALVIYRYRFGSEFTRLLAEKVFYKSPFATFEQKISKKAEDKLEE